MKRLLLTLALVLTFGLSVSANGQDASPKFPIMVANQSYAVDLYEELCVRHEMYDAKFLSNLNLAIRESNRAVTLWKGCSIRSFKQSCVDAIDDFVDGYMPLIDQFLTSLETLKPSPQQCISVYNSFVEKRIVAYQRLNAELESILLSDN